MGIVECCRGGRGSRVGRAGVIILRNNITNNPLPALSPKMSSLPAYNFYLFPHRPKGNTFLAALRLSIAISAQLDDLLLISLHSPLFRVATAPPAPAHRQLANCKEASPKSCLCSTCSQLLDAWGQTQGQGLKGPRLGQRQHSPGSTRPQRHMCCKLAPTDASLHRGKMAKQLRKCQER